MLEYRKPKSEVISYKLVKQKFIMKIEAGEISFAILFSNGAELDISVKSICKPDLKEVSKVLEMLKVSDFCVKLCMEEKNWEIMRLNTLTLKETFEALANDFIVPLTRYEKDKKRKQEKEQKSSRKIPDSKENIYYKSSAQIIELTSLSLFVPHSFDPYLDSFTEILKPFLTNTSHDPVSPSDKHHDNAMYMLRKDIFSLFDHKYILSLIDLKLTFEDNPLEVVYSSHRLACFDQRSF